jgi:hypothetical protein
MSVSLKYEDSVKRLCELQMTRCAKLTLHCFQAIGHPTSLGVDICGLYH